MGAVHSAPEIQNTSKAWRPTSQWHFSCIFCMKIVLCFFKVEQNWATLQGGEMTIQTTQASEATQAVASLAEAAVAASQEIQPGATVTMALNRWCRRLEYYILQCWGGRGALGFFKDTGKQHFDENICSILVLEEGTWEIWWGRGVVFCFVFLVDMKYKNTVGFCVRFHWHNPHGSSVPDGETSKHCRA